MTSTVKMPALTDFVPAALGEKEVSRIRQEYASHSVTPVPSRSFLMRHPDPRYGMMESGLMVWTPGVLTLGGDLGDLVFSHCNFDTLEHGLGWLAHSTDLRYLASKTNARREYQAQAALAQVTDDLIESLKNGLSDQGFIGENGQVVDPLPERTDLDTDYLRPWLNLAYIFDMEGSEMYLAANREKALHQVNFRFDFAEPDDFYGFYKDVFEHDEPPWDSVMDYNESVLRRIMMAQAFAATILASPEFSPAEEAAADLAPAA